MTTPDRRTWGQTFDPGDLDASATVGLMLDALACSRSALTEAGPARTAPPVVVERPAAPNLVVAERIGVGGMGEVWAATDTRLGCEVALKTLRADLAQRPDLRQRFLAEARLTAGLQHPGIVPVHELGELGDGRPFYTMRRVEGQPLAALLAQDGQRWPLRALLGLMVRVCEAVGYAHAQGVVHADLKPDNVRVGRHGEVMVLDWGVALRAGQAVRDLAGGVVFGSPPFMAPEVGGPDGVVEPAADVYALGVMITLIVDARRRGGEGDMPALVELAASARAADPGRRPPNAAALGEALGGWLDGARRRERALAVVAEADALQVELERLRGESGQLEADHRRLAAGLHPWDLEAKKRALWEVEARMEDVARGAALLETRVEQTLGAALQHDPELTEAHERLAARYRRLHELAEQADDVQSAQRWELLLRAHDRGAHSAYLRGDAALTLVTEPPGAQVQLLRYERGLGRWSLAAVGELGPTPLVEHRVPHGSYLLRISAPGCYRVDHPVWLRRLEHADGIAPGESAPRPIVMPRAGTVPNGAVYVTPGWTWVGSDPAAANPAPTLRIWVEGFFIERTPVTNAQYLDFLHALVDAGRVEEALRHAPREMSAHADTQGELLVGWDGRRFTLQADAQGDRWLPEWPVLMVDWYGAQAYAAWRAEVDGLPWRLPREDEWERAARGADHRPFPWGDRIDPSLCCYRSSHPDGVRPTPQVPGRFDADVSPFGVRDLGGNVRDACTNVWGGDSEVFRTFPVVRGGAWNGHPLYARCATRAWTDPRGRAQHVGFRLVLPLSTVRPQGEL